MESHNHIEFARREAIAYQKGYRVSKDGTFYSNRGNEIKYVCRDGYVRTSLKVNGKNKMLFAHRLQAYQKYGDAIYSKGILVRHLDGNKTNNHIDNIAIGTNRDNMMDRDKADRVAQASKAARQTIRYNRDEVVDFYENCGRSRKKTMDHFNISSTGTLHYILNHRKFNDKL